MERELRYADSLKVERRQTDQDTRRVIRGHAAVFNEEANIGDMFREVIRPGAFRRAIRDDDVRALINHDRNLVLGRNRAGTLRLAEDDVGLAVEIDLPDTDFANNLLTSIERQDINQMSFAFRAIRQEFDDSDDPPLRILHEVELFDVSAVTFPAFPTTDIGLRHLEQNRDARNRDAASVVKARLRMRQDMLERGLRSR